MLKLILIQTRVSFLEEISSIVGLGWIKWAIHIKLAILEFQRHQGRQHVYFLKETNS